MRLWLRLQRLIRSPFTIEDQLTTMGQRLDHVTKDLDTIVKLHKAQVAMQRDCVEVTEKLVVTIDELTKTIKDVLNVKT